VARPSVASPRDDEPILTPEDALEPAAIAWFTGLGVAASQNAAVAGSGTLQTLMPVLTTLLGVATTRFGKQVMTQRLPKWVDGFGKAFDNDTKQVKAHVAERIEDDDYHETVFRSFRMMVDAADPEVTRILGFLVGEYSKHKLKRIRSFEVWDAYSANSSPGSSMSSSGCSTALKRPTRNRRTRGSTWSSIPSSSTSMSFRGNRETQEPRGWRSVRTL
jgi:hypothetical protein